jgi:hypothetical protein
MVGVIIAALNRSPELGATVLVLVIVAALFLPFVARALERRRARTVGDNPMTPFH